MPTAYAYIHTKTKIVLNFRLNVSNDLKFTSQLQTMKINISRTFGKKLAKIDTVTSYFILAVVAPQLYRRDACACAALTLKILSLK